MKIRLRDLARIAGWMAVSSRANGSIIICMVWASTPGPMAGAIWASTKTIRNTAMVFINGPMVVFIWVNGCVASNMDSECIRPLTKITPPQL